ncbi:MAG: hypothetical protein AAF809_06815 [Bacteroidota bacterium]
MRARPAFALCLAASLVALLVTAPEAQAQWPRGQGQGYAQLGVGLAGADRGFDGDRNLGTLGSEENPETYSEAALYAYAEVGLTNRITLIGSTFLRSSVAENLDGEFVNGGLSDVTLQVRYSLPQLGPLVVSPQVGVRLPTGYDAEDSPPLGSGEADLLAEVQFGLSLWPTPAYVGGSVGYRQRGGIIEDEILAFLEAGYFVTETFLLRARGDLTESTSNEITEFSQLGFPPEQGFVTLGPGVTVVLSERWQLNGDLRWTVSGRTTARIVNGIVGLALVW